MHIIAAKLCLAVICAGVLHMLWRRKSKWTIDFTVAAVLLGGAKLALAILLYTVFGDAYLRSDPQSYYFPWFAAAWEWGVIYRDFYSTFNPLFPYIFGAFYAAGQTLGFVVTLVLLETSLYVLLVRFLIRDPTPLRSYLLLALIFSPISMSYVLVEGQEDFLILGVFTLCLSILLRGNKSLTAGLIYSVGYLSTKILTLIALPVLLLCATRKRRFLAGLLPIVLVYVVLYLSDADILIPLQQVNQTTSGNILFLLSQVTPVPDSLRLVALPIVFAGLCYVYLSHPLPDVDGACFIYCLLWAMFLLLSPKSDGAYYLAFYPLFFVLLCRGNDGPAPPLIWLQVPVAVHHTVWYRQADVFAYFGNTFANAIEIGLGVILVTILSYVCVVSFRRIRV